MQENYKAKNREYTHSNLTKKEKSALKTLGSEENLIIKAADKGGGIVVMDTQKYLRMCQSLIEDKETYKELKTHPMETFNIKLQYVLDEASYWSGGALKIR